jgi:ADP-ribose pyrophosphatase
LPTTDNIDRDSGRWHCLESTKVFEVKDDHTVYMEVFQDKVKTSTGKIVSYARYHSSDVAIVVPILDDGRLVMIRQYRYPLDKFMLEFPAGHIEKGEDPAYTARRELEEETGYRAGKIECIYRYHPSVSKSRQLVHVFEATGLVPGSQRLDGTESISTKILTVAELRDLILQNKVENAGTLVSFLLCCSGLNFRVD